MENLKEQQNIEQEQSLEKFKREIGELRENHQKEHGENSNPDLVNVDPSKLTRDDMEMWQGYRELASRKINKQEFEEICRKLEEYKGTVDIKKEPERNAFEMLMANKITGLMLNLEE